MELVGVEHKLLLSVGVDVDEAVEGREREKEYQFYENISYIHKNKVEVLNIYISHLHNSPQKKFHFIRERDMMKFHVIGRVIWWNTGRRLRSTRTLEQQDSTIFIGRINIGFAILLFKSKILFKVKLFLLKSVVISVVEEELDRSLIILQLL